MFGGWTMFSQIMQHNGDVQIQFLYFSRIKKNGESTKSRISALKGKEKKVGLKN